MAGKLVFPAKGISLTLFQTKRGFHIPVIRSSSSFNERSKVVPSTSTKLTFPPKNDLHKKTETKFGLGQHLSD